MTVRESCIWRQLQASDNFGISTTCLVVIISDFTHGEEGKLVQGTGSVEG